MEEEKKTEQKHEKQSINQKVLEKVESKIEELINNEGVNKTTIDYLYKLIDVKKDIKNEEYWKVKEENYMRYRGYSEGGYNEGGYSAGGYGRRGVKGTGRGRYRGGRGSGRYRGEDAMEEMQDQYQAYSEAREEYNRGNYGAEGGMVESVEGIMESVYDIVEEIAQEGSPEVMQIVKKYSKKISEMA